MTRSHTGVRGYLVGEKKTRTFTEPTCVSGTALSALHTLIHLIITHLPTFYHSETEAKRRHKMQWGGHQ